MIRVYINFINCSSDVIGLYSTSHPLVPLRLVATCSDAAVRLVAPVSGTILTTALLPTSSTIINTVYKPLEGEEGGREGERGREGGREEDAASEKVKGGRVSEWHIKLKH